jgi:hypothetical protein
MYCPICGAMLVSNEVRDSVIGIVQSTAKCPEECYTEELSYGAYRIYVGKKCFDLGNDLSNRKDVRNAITIMRQERRNGYSWIV